MHNGCRRQALKERIEKNEKQFMVNEILNDIFVNVKTPTPPPPNIRDPLIFCYLFENNNKKLRLHFDKPIMDKYFEIIKEISELTVEPIPDSEIDCSIPVLYDNIKKIDVYYNHGNKGADILKEFKVYDKEFLDTIRYHHTNYEDKNNKLLDIIRESDNQN